MKRRDVIRLMPLSLAAAGIGSRAFASPATNGPFLGGAEESLGKRYLKRVRERITLIRETQSDNMLEAAYAIAERVAKGRTCWYSWDMGHTTTADLTPGRNGVPEIFTTGYDASKSRDGDLFLANIGGGTQELLDKDIFVVGSPVPWSMDAAGDQKVVYASAMNRIRPYCDIWIETKMTKIGAIMEVPGMPNTGPVSGLIGMVTYWMMVGDTCRILAREGKSIPVRGDEPALAKDTPTVSLATPLMDDYYDVFMKQHEMIEAEFGNIRKVASMAIDAVLSGGRVQCYGRYPEALPREAKNRRGGLSFTQGVAAQNGKLTGVEADFVPSDRDLVIMGFYQPDDPVDLESLDKFRKMGAKIASIGPMTRGGRIPEGRTVPKESDVHIGRMCDTYGLYALPGFERHVCPTSGAMMNQMFWESCMEMVEELYRRTGDMPGIFLSGAIEGGIAHMRRVQELYRVRGY